LSKGNLNDGLTPRKMEYVYFVVFLIQQFVVVMLYDCCNVTTLWWDFPVAKLKKVTGNPRNDTGNFCVIRQVIKAASPRRQAQKRRHYTVIAGIVQRNVFTSN